MELSKECISVINYIIEKINEYNKGKKNLKDQLILSTKRLQKIVYFCELEYMKRTEGKKLFEDNYYAWPNGPVIEKIFREYFQYSDAGLFPRMDLTLKRLPNDIKIIVDEVLTRIKDMDTRDLINSSCIENSPWYNVYSKTGPLYSEVIPKEELYKFYKNRDILTAEQDFSLKKTK